MLGNAAYGIVTGEIIIQYGMVKKADDSLLYWVAFIGSTLVGAACVFYFFF